MKTLAKSIKKSGEIQKEALRITKACKLEGMDESYVPFIKSFVKHLVREADEMQSPEEFTPDQTAQAFEGSLEPDTPADQFDTQGTDPNVLADAISAVRTWSDKLEEFVKFLNDPKTQSLHKVLATQDRPGSLVKGITRKTSDSISRIAGEIAKLKQTLDGFINLAPKKQRDSDALVAQGTGSSPAGAPPAV